MVHSILYPPNFNKLGSSVICDVMLRSKPACVAENGGNSVDKHRNQIHLVSSFKGQERSPTTATLRPQADMDSVLIDNARIELRRQRRRVNMARYRERQINRSVTLENDIRQLHDEIEKLKLQRQLIGVGVPTRKTLWNVVAEYFRLFRYGYKALVCVSGIGRTHDVRESDVQREFLQASMSPNVTVVAASGIEALLEHWRALSLCFPDIEMELTSLESRAGNALLAIAKMKVTVTDQALHHVFPHLVNSKRSPLAVKLLNQHLVIRESVHFEWDNDKDCVTKLHHCGDLLTPVLQLLGSLEDVAIVFDKARINSTAMSTKMWLHFAHTSQTFVSLIKISMGWKAVESEEYESSAPAVQAHFHAVRAEEALRRDDHVQAEKEGHLASEKFLQAAQRVSDKRTIDALMLLAENYEYRAKVARARNPRPVETEEKTKEEVTVRTEDKRELRAEQKETEVEAVDPKEAQKAETQLNVAAAEMEELWRRLNEIGLSSPGSADKNLLMSSRHLSSSLGDSFCLLPAKTRTTIGVVATAVDGGSTLRAAVASRMRNQRQRLMEQQLGGRVPLDPRRPGGIPTNGNDESAYRYHDRRSSMHADDSTSVPGDYEALQETVAHQKMEIVRLLNTVKTLSSENTKLVKKCEALTNIQAENREIRDSMDLFKKDYNQKLVMIKRALEEWRRQRNSVVQASSHASVAGGSNSVLENKLKMQKEQIATLVEEARMKDDRIAKYDKWYKTLKAGAKAKQLSQSHDSRDEANSFSTSSSFVQNGGGSLSGPSNSFTNSSSFHSYRPGSAVSAGSTSNTSRQFNRPPAHPNRRAL